MSKEILRCKWCNREIRQPLRKNQKYCNNWDRNLKGQICVNAHSTWKFNKKRKLKVQLAKSQLTRPTLPAYKGNSTHTSITSTTKSILVSQNGKENMYSNTVNATGKSNTLRG